MHARLILSVSLVLLLGLLGASTANGADPNLVGWWKFEEASGTLYDQSDRHNDGTSFNGVLYQQPGREGYSLGFDGIDDYVVVGSTARPTNTFSFGGWLKTSVTHEIEAESISGAGGTANQRYVFEPQHGGDLNAGAGLSVGTNGIAVYEHGSNYMPATAVYSAEIGSGWNHIMVVYSNRRPTIYLNGRAVRTGLSGPRAIVYAPIQLGGMAYGYFAGLMDEIRIYNKALSAAEVQVLAYWPEAHSPDPADGATGVLQPLLKWTAGDGAALHDVYFGTNPTPGPAEFITRYNLNMYWYGPGLIPGTTYYWRIDEVEADGVTIHTGDVWSFTAAPSTAYNPNPADGAKYVATDADLSWTAGVGGITHDVYFGTNKADVTNGTGGTLKASRQTGKTYEPGALAKGTVYCWRIDEFEAGGTKHPGAVWSFTTLPDIPIADPNLLGWWKLDEGFGTIVIDWSGHDNHGTINNLNGGRGAGGSVWYSDAEYGTVASFGGDDSSGAHIRAGSIPAMSLTNDFTWTFWAKQDGDGTGVNQTILGNRYGGTASPLQFIKFTPTQFEFYNGSLNGIDYDDIPGGVWIHHAIVKDGTSFTYYRNGVSSGSNTITTTVDPNPFFMGGDAGGERWRGWLSNVRIYNRALTQQEIKQTMRADPLIAWDPNPANGSTPDIDGATPLSWKPGDRAAQHDVYLGTEEAAVRNADKADTTGIYRGQQAAATYTPSEALEWGQTYYWRVDEYNTDGTTSTGKVWTFTVASYLIADDFESYTDDVGSRIFQTWKDGWGYSEPAPGYPGNGSGSTVGYAQAPFAEQTTVHGGVQSMPLGYDNTGATGKARYSETVREWATPQDWTRYNVKALTLYFYGAPANDAEQLYVALEDNAGHVNVVNHPDIEAVQGGAWQEWNMELTQFSGAGVNLKAIKKMYIGLGNRASPKAGGTGTIFIDDIRVYPSRCVPSMGKPAADLSGNCVVDAADVDILANQWLNSGFQITPVNPGTAGLVAQYPFNGNANDAVGGHNGTPTGGPVYTTGKVGQAILLDGVDDVVNVGAVGISGAAPRTIAGWAKANATTAIPDWTTVFGFSNDLTANQAGTYFDIQRRGAQMQYCIHVYGWEQNLVGIDLDWHHLAATYDGTTIAWYADGRLVNSQAYTINTLDRVMMGKRGDRENYFPGRIDEVYVYNRALSDAQIAWLAAYTSALSIPADLQQDNVINFKDFAKLADSWLEAILWP